MWGCADGEWAALKNYCAKKGKEETIYVVGTINFLLGQRRRKIGQGKPRKPEKKGGGNHNRKVPSV